MSSITLKDHNGYVICELGTVLDEDIKLDNRLTVWKRPAGSSENTTVLNLFGKQRTITIQGFQDGTGYSGASVEIKIKKFIDDIEDWANANIQTGRVYTDSFGESYQVLATIFRWSRTAPGNRIIYTLTMIQGGALSAFSP